MEEVLQFEAIPEDASEMKSAIAQMMAEMDELHRLRRQDQADIEQAQAETRAMLDTIAEVLAELKAA